MNSTEVLLSRWYRGVVFDLLQRLLDLLSDQAGGVVRPLQAQRLGKGMEREISSNRRDEGDRNVRPVAQLLLQGQWLVAARFFRGLRKYIYSLRKHCSACSQKWPSTSSVEAMSTRRSKARRRLVRTASSGTPRMMVEPSAQRRDVFSAMAATSSVRNTLSFLAGRLDRSFHAG